MEKKQPKKVRIEPQGANYDNLQKTRLFLKIQCRRFISWNETLEFIFNLQKELKKENKKFQRKIRSLEKKFNLEQTKRLSFAENIALTLAKRPPAVIQANPSMSQQTAVGIPPPPPPKRKAYIPQHTQDIKKDYVHEIKQIFTGEVLSPAQVIQITKPKHLDAKVIEFTDDFEIPVLKPNLPELEIET